MRHAQALQLCAPCGAPHSLQDTAAHARIHSSPSTAQQHHKCTGMCHSTCRSLLHPSQVSTPARGWHLCQVGTRLILGFVRWQHSCARPAGRARPRSGSSCALSLQGASATAQASCLLGCHLLGNEVSGLLHSADLLSTCTEKETVKQGRQAQQQRHTQSERLGRSNEVGSARHPPGRNS